MDLQLYFRVLWRFRILVLTGLMLAVALSFLSYVRVDFRGTSPSFSFREPEIWQSRATLWITHENAAYLQLLRPEEVEGRPSADFSGLAVLYAQLAQSDAVRARMLNAGPISGSVTVEPAIDERDSVLPFLGVTALAASPLAAVELAQRQIDAFVGFLEDQQREQGIRPGDRVVVRTMVQPTPPVVVDGRAFTRPIVVFLTALIAVLGLAFILENLRPRVRPVASHEEVASAPPQSSRRSA